jgi:hypothetical protein
MEIIAPRSAPAKKTSIFHAPSGCRSANLHRKTEYAGSVWLDGFIRLLVRDPALWSRPLWSHLLIKPGLNQPYPFYSCSSFV